MTKKKIMKNATQKITSVILLLFTIIASTISGYAIGENNISHEMAISQKQKRITGRITDSNGNPMVGVTALERGTSNGTVSNNDGLYSLEVSSSNPQIEYTYIGYEPSVVNIGASLIYDITMTESTNDLNEVVVVGYGKQKKVSLVGSQETLMSKDLKVPSASISTAMAGKLAGVTVLQRTGEPGSDAADIWIRGYSTPNGATPLIIVDGVEREFNNIDPNDIESISILKDASATAVYGVRGANGVIIVTTKPGKLGKPSVTIDYNETTTKFTQTPQLADGVKFMQYANLALANDNKAALYSDEYIERTASQIDPLLYPNVDWMDEVFEDSGRQRRINANISGGSQMAQFYASLSYFNESGMIKESAYENLNTGIDYNRYNFLTNLNLNVTPTTTVKIGVQGYMSSGNYPSESSSTLFTNCMEVNSIQFPVMYTLDGVEYVPGVHTQGGERNPYAEATKRGYRTEMNSNVMSNLRVEQNLDMITTGLSASAMFAFDLENNRTLTYSKRENTYYFVDKSTPYDEYGIPILAATWDSGTTELSYGNSFGGERKVDVEANINYARTFADKHDVSAMAVFTQQSRTNNTAGDLISSLDYRLQGVAGRVTYSYDNRYLAEFNIGYNGGENFPEEKRFGTFPAIGIGWIASEEPFWGSIKDVVSFLKFRYTNGLVGSSSVDGRRFMYVNQYERNSNYGYSFGNNVDLSGVIITNPASQLSWEVAHKQDLGIDLKLFNGFNMTADVYKERRENILMERSQSLPSYAGFQSYPYGNVGITSTKGVDITMDYYQRINNDWGITVRGNLSYYDSQWVDDDIPDTEYEWRNREGHSLLAVEGFTAVGLYTQEDIDAINEWLSLTPSQQESTQQPLPTPYNISLDKVNAGDIKYKDLNSDGVIDDDDISWIGNGDIPQISYGFGFNIDYKQFSVGLLFQGTAMASRLINGIVFAYGSPNSAVYDNIDDCWTEENPSQDVFYPRLSYGSDSANYQNNTLNSTWWLKDMSFLRLKNLQISYAIPEHWNRAIGINNASVYILGTNLLTFSDWKLWDPELNTSTGMHYPNSTTYSIGVNFKF